MSRPDTEELWTAVARHYVEEHGSLHGVHWKTTVQLHGVEHKLGSWIGRVRRGYQLVSPGFRGWLMDNGANLTARRPPTWRQRERAILLSLRRFGRFDDLPCEHHEVVDGSRINVYRLVRNLRRGQLEPPRRIHEYHPAVQALVPPERGSPDRTASEAGRRPGRQRDPQASDLLEPVRRSTRDPSEERHVPAR